MGVHPLPLSAIWPRPVSMACSCPPLGHLAPEGRAQGQETWAGSGRGPERVSGVPVTPDQGPGVHRPSGCQRLSQQECLLT